MNPNDLVKFIREMVRPLKQAVLLLVSRGIILSSSDSGNLQTVQATLLKDETKDQVERFGHFGLAYDPPEKTECIMVSVGASRDHGVIIATENRALRFKNVGKGNSALYNASGKYLWLKENNLEIKASKVKINNDSEEMVAVVSDFMNEVINGLVITAIGPQPWEPATKQKLIALKAKFDTFKL